MNLQSKNKLKYFNDVNPKINEIYSLHYQICKSNHKDKWVELVLTHSQIVNEISMQFIPQLEKVGFDIDVDFIQQAVLLHDIGVYSCFDSQLNSDSTKPKYICHGQIGYDIIMDNFGNKSLARIALTHTGFGGISVYEIEKDNLPLKKMEMKQVSIEEQLVAWADKFHTKWPRFYSLDEVRNSALEFGEENHNTYTKYKDKFGIPELSNLTKKYENWHKEFDEYIESISV